MNHGTHSRQQAGGEVAQPDLNSPGMSSNLTIAGPVHLGEGAVRGHGGSSSATPGGKKQKICCACGKDVAHEERFKDRAGYYWCMDCGVQENRQKHTIGHATDEQTCPDCSGHFPADQLVEFETLHLCAGCINKRQQAGEREATRQAARKAAALQDFLDAERRRHRILIASAVAAACAVGLAVYVLMF